MLSELHRFPGKGSFSFWRCGLIPDKGWRAPEEGFMKEPNREGVKPLLSKDTRDQAQSLREQP